MNNYFYLMKFHQGVFEFLNLGQTCPKEKKVFLHNWHNQTLVVIKQDVYDYDYKNKREVN